MCLSIAIERPGDVLARGEHAGFEWVVTHNGCGFRCGYVRMPPGHPWHGMGYDDVEADVHGSLTFARADVGCDAGGPDDGWWLGFDCGHAGDAPDPDLEPALLGAMRAACDARVAAGMARCFGPHWRRGLQVDVVRTQEYVEAQCRSLCEQAAAAREGDGR